MQREDLPRLVAQAIEELELQRPAGGPLTLALPGRELALTLSQTPPAWRVGRGCSR